MDTWHDDVKVDDMKEEFLKYFRSLMPDDRDLFFSTLKDEYAQIKQLQAQGFYPLEMTDTKEYINTIQQEITEIKDQTINTTQEESKDNQVFKEESHINQESIDQNKIVTNQSLSQENLQEYITKEKENFIQENKESLKDLELVSEQMLDDTPLMLYSNEIIFPEQNMNAFENTLATNPKAKLADHLNINDIKQNLAKEREFQDVFTQEVASLSDEAPSIEKEQKLNPDNYFKDLINWFDKKKLENENIPLTKQEFKQEFLEYCKNGMNENEMKILLLLANKEPSKLTKEHRDMINEGLKFNLTNTKLLDKGLEIAIRAEIGENLINNDVNDFAKSMEKLKKSDSLIDKKMMKGTTQKLANKVKEQTPNITPNNAQKLESIALDKEMPKTQAKGKSR